MSAPFPLEEWAGMVLPSRCTRKLVAMLYAYFDESGTGKPGKTVIAGFVGTSADWIMVREPWEKALGGKVFHYTKMRGPAGHQDWFGVDEDERKNIIDECAGILARSKLKTVAGGFVGDWNAVLAAGPGDWAGRIPSAYQLCFEMCVEQMDRASRALWGGEPIALIFSAHQQYGRRAEDTWRMMRDNGYWQNVPSFTYAEPKDVPYLGCADMVVYETYQGMGSKQGNVANVGGFVVNDTPQCPGSSSPSLEPQPSSRFTAPFTSRARGQD